MLKQLSEGKISQDVRLFLLTNLLRTTEPNNGVKWEWRCNLNVIEEYLYQIGSFPFRLVEDPLGVFAEQPPVQFLGNNVLFLRGENSMYVTDRYEETSRMFFPNAHFKTIKVSYTKLL